MHTLLEEELVRMGNNFGGSSSSGAAEVQEPPPEPALKEAWITAMKNSFERMDMIAANSCVCERTGDQCSCSSQNTAGLTGSTAVVVVLTDEHIVVANCGDSRAVLGRRGRAFPLSNDHKVSINQPPRTFSMQIDSDTCLS